MSEGRFRERRAVQEVSYEEMEGIRRREYDGMRKEFPRRDLPSQSLIRAPRADPQWSDGDDDEYDRDDYEVDHHKSRRYRGSADRVPRSMALDRFRRPSSHHGPDRRRWSSDNSESDGDVAYRRRRSSRPGHPRNNRQSMAVVEKEVEDEFRDRVKKDAVNPKDDGYLWYSMKKRNEANFLEKHFDSSYDGLIAGVAGAAIGSITAARFGGQQHKTAKAVGGAVLGALAFNAAESHWRCWTEMAEEVKEKRDEAKEELKDVAEKARRFVPQH